MCNIKLVQGKNYYSLSYQWMSAWEINYYTAKNGPEKGKNIPKICVFTPKFEQVIMMIFQMYIH